MIPAPTRTTAASRTSPVALIGGLPLPLARWPCPVQGTCPPGRASWRRAERSRARRPARVPRFRPRMIWLGNVHRVAGTAVARLPVASRTPPPGGRGMEAGRPLTRSSRLLVDATRAVGPHVLFGLRLWASVCLALYLAFWLELDNAFWAGTSAAIVCQPRLGASLRKGWFRMVGTVVGATVIVVLTACFPQDRAAFLVGLALWCAACTAAATLLHNFASYAAALAGYTAAIIAYDQLGATGGPNGQVFMLAVTRATEICIGIVSAGLVLALTDLGGARRRLAESLAASTAEISGRFVRSLRLTGARLQETQVARRELVARVGALDPAIDEAIGESWQLRDHLPVLQTAVEGLFGALSGWRAVAVHLESLPDDEARRQGDAVTRSGPTGPLAGPYGDPTRWMRDPRRLRGVCEAAVRTLSAPTAETPALRLLADQTARVLDGIRQALDGLVLLGDGPARPPAQRGRARLRVADWLP